MQRILSGGGRSPPTTTPCYTSRLRWVETRTDPDARLSPSWPRPRWRAWPELREGCLGVTVGVEERWFCNRNGHNDFGDQTIVPASMPPGTIPPSSAAHRFRLLGGCPRR